MKLSEEAAIAHSDPVQSNAMALCFRIRFVLGRSSAIGSDQTEIAIADPIEGRELRLRPTDSGTSLSEAKALVLTGRPFDSERDAHTAAERWLGVLQKVFAHLHIGADFGDRAAGGGLYKQGLRMFEGLTGQRVLNDDHGILVYECEPEPRFARVGAVNVVTGPGGDRLISEIERASRLRVEMSTTERLAFDLYAASFSESSPDARLAMLMMAMETLIEPGPRSTVVREHVDRMIAATRSSGLGRQEIDSIVGSLQWLLCESINQAGRKLAARLGNRKYMDEAPSKFFTSCYGLRSRLFHGHEPRPTRAEVGTRAASLEHFVGDLLSLELGTG